MTARHHTARRRHSFAGRDHEIHQRPSEPRAEPRAELDAKRLRRALADLVYEVGADYMPDEIPLGSPLGRALHALAGEPDCPDCRAALSALAETHP